MRKLLFSLTILFMGVAMNAQGLFISEVADPGDAYKARFVELYNASSSDIDLTAGNYYLTIQVNGGSYYDVQLTGTITAGGTYVVAYSQTDFNTAFGFDPDLANGNINGNGDDGYFLYVNGDHTTGTLVDAYGVPDEDGTGKDWEYTDAHAVRNANIVNPNTTWTASEWTITAANVADCTPGQHTVSTSSPTQLAVAADPVISYDGTTKLTITAVDDNGTPSNVSGDVTVNLSVTNGTGTLSPTTATITGGTASVEVTVTYDKYEDITITAEDAAGNLASGTVDVQFKEALINVFPYTRDFADQNVTTDGWQVWHKTGQYTADDGSVYDYYDVDWGCSYGEYISYGSYDGGNKPPALAYFISPRIDVSNLTNPVLAFDFSSKYVSTEVPLKVVYSTDYSGSGDPTSATWNELTTVTENLNSTSAWKFAGQYTLPKETNLYIAFVYEAPNGESSIWQVDNIYVGEKMFQMLGAFSVGDNKVLAFFSDAIPSTVSADQFSVAGTAASSMDIDPNDPTVAVLTFANNFDGDNVKDVLSFNNPQTGGTDVAEFYAGVLPIAAFNPASGTDVAIPNEDVATFRGTVVYVTSKSAIIYDGKGEFTGIEVYDGGFAGAVSVGDSVLVVGGLNVYHDYPEINPVVYAEKLGTGTLTAAAMELDPTTFIGTDPITDEGAKYIGKLVTVKSVVAGSYDADGHGFWNAVVNTDGDKIWFDDRFYPSAFNGSEMVAGKVYDITGFVAYSWGRYIICPRSSDDIAEFVPAAADDLATSVKVYPNPATDYIMLSTQANQVDVFSTTGQLLKSVQNTNRVDVSSLEAGTYMARIVTNDGVVVKPFIKK